MLNDAPQQALSFLLSNIAHIETQVWARKYPAITYPEFVPVDTSANAWTRTITFMSTDATGKAKFLNALASDFPTVTLDREKHESEVYLAGIAYTYNLEELEQARLANIPLTADKAAVARRVYEEFVEDMAYTGGKGLKGILNHASPTRSDAPAGASTATEWTGKTADEILTDVNGAITGIWIDTKEIGMADTILLPLAQYSLIATKRLTNDMPMTILEWIEKNNIYTKVTGQKLTVRANRHLATAGAGSTARMVAYRRDPEVLKMHMPMPLQFIPPQQVALNYTVHGIFRLGGVDIRLPKEVRYVDLI